MLQKVVIDSFKSIESAKIELGQVNVFIGANGSGKSNLLEALGVLSAAASGRVDDEALLRRGVRPGVPRLYKSAFPQTGQRKPPHIFFGAHNDAASYEAALFNPLDDPQPAWRYHTEALYRGEEKIVGRNHRMRPAPNPEAGLVALESVKFQPGDAALALLEALRSYAIYTPNTPCLRGLVQDQQPRTPVGLSGGALPQGLLELLKEKKKHQGIAVAFKDIHALIDWAKSFGAAPSSSMPLSPSAATTKQVVKFRDRFMAEGRNLLSGYDASEGALYVLYAAVLALHPKAPKLLAIDNLDQALNPRLARRLADRLCQWVLDAPEPRQLLVTAHNPVVLDGLPLQDDRVRLFTVDRDNRGTTVFNQVKLTKELLAKAQQGWTLSRLWVMGHIGGVPNV